MNTDHEEKKARLAQRRLERILSTCMHHSGNPCAARCGAGVELFTVRRYIPGLGGRFEMPCESPEVDTCPKRQLQTREDFERGEEESRQSLDRCKQVREVISMATAAETGNCSGSFRCPSCGHGRVRFRVSSNGHAQASCSTSGCVDFIE